MFLSDSRLLCSRSRSWTRADSEIENLGKIRTARRSRNFSVPNESQAQYYQGWLGWNTTKFCLSNLDHTQIHARTRVQFEFIEWPTDRRRLSRNFFQYKIGRGWKIIHRRDFTFIPQICLHNSPLQQICRFEGVICWREWYRRKLFTSNNCLPSKGPWEKCRVHSEGGISRSGLKFRTKPIYREKKSPNKLANFCVIQGDVYEHHSNTIRSIQKCISRSLLEVSTRESAPL